MLKSIMFPLVLLFGLIAPERSAQIVAAPVDLVVAVPVELVIAVPAASADVVEQHLQLEFGVKKTKSKQAKTTTKSKKEQTKKKPAFKSKAKSKSTNRASTFSHVNPTSPLTGPPQYR